MQLNEDSKVFKDCMFLIDKGLLEIENIPDVLNLRKLVEDALNKN